VSSGSATTIPWEVEAQCVGDNTGGRVMGRGTGELLYPSGTNAISTLAALAVAPSSVNFATEPPLQFTVGLVTAAANLLGSGVASLTSFVLEA